MRKGDWIQTVSGIAFWPFDPRPDEINITDIAHALSNLCRFGGHCKSFYSVAEHSVYVSRQCPPELALCGLLHDASEAYLVDVPRPIKRLLAGYAEIEDSIQAVIAARFGIPNPIPAEVKAADNAVLAAEARQIMASPPMTWRDAAEPADCDIQCYRPLQARMVFAAEYARLTGVCL